MTTVGDSSIPVSRDLVCVRCGYDLRGIALDHPCPECGLAAHRTLAAGAGGEITDAVPTWVTIVALGATLLFVAYIGPAIAVAVGTLGIFKHDRFAGPVALLIIAAFHCLGAWLITASEPGGSVATRRKIRQRTLSIVVRALAMVPVLAMPYFLYTMRRRGWEDDRALIASMGALMTCPALTMVRLQYLTRRLGRPNVAEHAFLAGFDLSLTLIISASLAGVAYHSEWFIWIAGCMVAAAVFWVWSLWTLAMIARSLWTAAGLSRAAWHAADASRSESGSSL